MNKQNVLVTIFLVSVTLISMIQANTLKTRNQPDSISYVSYPTIQNLTELYNRSDIVIHGVVESSRIETPFDGFNVPDVVTKFTVYIVEVLNGEVSEPCVVVMQEGGFYRGTVHRVKGDSLMMIRDEVVLYLSLSDYGYMIVGGPQGRFQIVDGKLYNIAEIDISITVVGDGLKTKGADVARLRELLIP